MKKSDLKNMMIVELRAGKRYVVVDDRIYNHSGYMSLSTFTDDLNLIDREYESKDIVKVYAPIKLIPTTADLDHVELLCALEWERKDDLDLPFNGKAVYTGTGQISRNGYTVGKIYKFKDGKTIDDDGTRRPILDESKLADEQYLTERGLKVFGFLKLIDD